MNASLVNWTAALDALGGSPGSPTPSALRAEASALAARASGDYAQGAARLAESIRLEPLNPLHLVRLALHHLRFGDSGEALAALERLPPGLRELALPGYLKALAELRGGEARRAANIAGSVLALHPDHRMARFLEAEAQLASAPKRVEKAFAALPREPELAAAWADLLVKALVLRPAELGPSVVQQLEVRKVLPKGSRVETLVRRALAWSEATPEVFETELEALAPGSRAEELALLLADQRALATDKDDSRLRLLRRLHERAPERRAARRLYASALTRRAVEEAAAERFPAALRLVDACLRLEPHETGHRQNRAALFTLMGEADASLEAWEDLERHHFRLALLGQLDPESARTYVRPHRMFARQARLTPGAQGPQRPQLGVFREVDKPGEEPALEVNQARLDTDPEQLRQWIHHRRAELAFSHLALGAAPERFLLQPLDPRMARARAEGLALGAGSLAVLVSGEGRLLAELLAARWREGAEQVETGYARPEADEEVRQLRARHVETFADVALLCRAWEPDAARPELAEELRELLHAEAPFFDEAALTEVLEARDAPPPWTVRVLNSYLRHTFGLEGKKGLELTPAQRAELAGGLEGELLLNLAVRRFEAAVTAAQLEQALGLVDRARQASPASPRVELWAARIALRADFLDEAKAALARLHAKVGGKENPYTQHVEELQRHLAEREKAAERGARREGAGGHSGAEPSGTRLEELEAELERLPSSVALYEELSHGLAAQGRFDVALAWAERAIARCLGRQGQLRARALELELLGLRALWAPAPDAVRRYLAGSRSGALEALPARDAAAPYPVEYLRGLCLLAAQRRNEARECFAAALARCDRQLHRAVLRPLAQSVEEALREQLRRAVEDALQGSAPGDALREVARALPELEHPEACLVDLARIQLALAAGALGAEGGAELPGLAVRAPWAARLRAAVASPRPLVRARALVALAEELHEPSAREVPGLLRRVELLERKERSAAALAESGRLLREGHLAPALAALDAVGAEAADEPAVLWQRALLALRLERFAEADEAVARLERGEEAVAREWLRRYPELGFRQRIATANRHLRQGGTGPARDVLAGARAVGQEQELELAYCRAFCLALTAYQHRGDGQLRQAVEALTAALELIEPLLPAARAAGQARLPELQAKLDQDLAQLQGEQR